MRDVAKPVVIGILAMLGRPIASAEGPSLAPLPDPRTANVQPALAAASTYEQPGFARPSAPGDALTVVRELRAASSMRELDGMTAATIAENAAHAIASPVFARDNGLAGDDGGSRTRASVTPASGAARP